MGGTNHSLRVVKTCSEMDAKWKAADGQSIGNGCGGTIIRLCLNGGGRPVAMIPLEPGQPLSHFFISKSRRWTKALQLLLHSSPAL